MSSSILTNEQRKKFDSDGYCILRGVISPEEALLVKGVILNHVWTPDLGEIRHDEADPADPMAGTGEVAARQARLRKLGKFGQSSPLLWQLIFTNPRVVGLAADFLGSDDLVLKFNSCFLKPPKTGSATPWHQDNGLWRDGEILPWNFWLAIDPATKENGCLQFVPGTHHGEILRHVKYPDGLHGELPRDRIAPAIERHGLHHAELEPGDAVCWHSSLWHYSPPNLSEQSRIGVAGVYTTAESARQSARHQTHLWISRKGRPETGFPPTPFGGYAFEAVPADPYPEAEAVALQA